MKYDSVQPEFNERNSVVTWTLQPSDAIVHSEAADRKFPVWEEILWKYYHDLLIKDFPPDCWESVGKKNYLEKFRI